MGWEAVESVWTLKPVYQFSYCLETFSVKVHNRKEEITPTDTSPSTRVSVQDKRGRLYGNYEGSKTLFLFNGERQWQLLTYRNPFPLLYVKMYFIFQEWKNRPKTVRHFRLFSIRMNLIKVFSVTILLIKETTETLRVSNQRFTVFIDDRILSWDNLNSS